MKSKYITIVVRVPDEASAKEQFSAALKSIQPFQTAMSMEDEMTALELIEGHEDFDPAIATEAREKTLKLHAAAEAAA